MSETGDFPSERRASKCGEDCAACARRRACALDFLTLEIERRAEAGRGAAEGSARLSW